MYRQAITKCTLTMSNLSTAINSQSLPIRAQHILLSMAKLLCYTRTRHTTNMRLTTFVALLHLIPRVHLLNPLARIKLRSTTQLHSHCTYQTRPSQTWLVALGYRTSLNPIIPTSVMSAPPAKIQGPRQAAHLNGLSTILPRLHSAALAWMAKAR